jgi:hypothetical protein
MFVHEFAIHEILQMQRQLLFLVRCKILVNWLFDLAAICQVVVEHGSEIALFQKLSLDDGTPPSA